MEMGLKTSCPLPFAGSLFRHLLGAHPEIFHRPTQSLSLVVQACLTGKFGNEHPVFVVIEIS